MRLAYAAQYRCFYYFYMDEEELRNAQQFLNAHQVSYLFVLRVFELEIDDKDFLYSARRPLWVNQLGQLSLM